MVERPSRNTRTDMEDDGGLLILLFSFLLLFHFSFSFLSFLCGAFFTTLFSSPSPTLSPSPPHPSTFPKKQKRRPEKSFLPEKERAHKEVCGNKRNKSRCGRKEENTGDEKGLSTSLWCVYSPHLLFSSSPPTPLLHHPHPLFSSHHPTQGSV